MAATPIRWYILFVYSCIGAQFMWVWFVFGSITTQVQDYYHLSTPKSGSVNHQIATILSLSPFVFLWISPVAVYILRYPVTGFQCAMRISAASSFLGMVFICIPSIFSSHFIKSTFNLNYEINGTFFNTLVFLYIGCIINSFSAPLFLSAPAKLSVMWFKKNERNTITAIGATIGNVGQCLSYFVSPLVVKTGDDLPILLYSLLITTFVIFCMTIIYFPAHPKTFPTLAAQISTMSSSHLLASRESPNSLSTLNGRAVMINTSVKSVPAKSIQTVQKVSSGTDSFKSSSSSMPNLKDIVIVNSSKNINFQINQTKTDVHYESDESISTDDSFDDDKMPPNIVKANEGNKSQYEPLPFMHTKENILHGIDNVDSPSAKQSQYEQLPFMHTNSIPVDGTDNIDTPSTFNLEQKQPHIDTEDDDNDYLPLPLAHSEFNLFPSEVDEDRRNFTEYIKILYKDFKLMISNRSTLLLIIAGGISVGVTSSWISVLQDMISPIGMSQHLIGFIGAGSLIMQVFGALFGGLIVDRFFSGKLKKCILVLQFMNVVQYLVISLFLPNCLFGNDTLLVIDDYSIRFMVIFVLCSIIGLNFGILTPLYFELLAESAFPVAETSTSNALMCICVPTMMLIMQIGSINTSLDTPIAVLLLTMAFIMDLFVIEQYKRPIHDIVTK